MKKIDIRKYTVFLLVCFLSFITYVSAASGTKIGFHETRLFATFEKYGNELT